MFAGLHAPARVEVFRVALETVDGERCWWRSRFYRYPERIGRDLLQARALEQRNAAVGALEQRRRLAEVVRLIGLEEGDASGWVYAGAGLLFHTDKESRLTTFPLAGARLTELYQQLAQSRFNLWPPLLKN